MIFYYHHTDLYHLYKNKTFSNIFTRQIDIDKKEAIEYFKFLKEKK